MADAQKSEIAEITYCPDCGPMAVSHGIERWKARFEISLGLLTKPPEKIWAWIKPAVSAMKPGHMAPAFARAAAAVRLGHIVDKPDENVNDRTRVIWEEADRRGIVMREFRPFGLPRELFWATYGGDTRAFDGLPRPRSAHETSINWMDDKGTILEKFRRAGVPVPRGKACRTLAQAEKIFNEVASDGTAVIVKPSIGSRSRHTYMDIKTIAALRAAFLKAKQLSPYAVVEEELPGFVYRITLVGGKAVGIMRREPPHVMADGAHTVHELVEEENKDPKRHGPIFHALEVDPDMLASQGFTLDSIPEKNKMVVLHPKVSRTFGASNTELTENIHPENYKLFTKIAEVLDDPLVGVDFIMQDITKPWQEQKSGVIECNSLPFIDLHHFPLKGPSVNVAGMVWDLVFPDSGNQ